MADLVIADFHHAGLYHGLMYLFQKRLGYDFRRPQGAEWWESGYLKFPGETDEPKHMANLVIYRDSDIPETDPDKITTSCRSMGKTITLQEALDRRKDIRFMVSSLYESEPCFAAFMADHCPNAALIRQCGNPHEIVRCTRHVLSSDLETYDWLRDTHHAILYHQEFSEKLFRFRKVRLQDKPRKVRTYINYLADNTDLRPRWEKLKALFDPEDVRFYMHGMHGTEGEFTDQVDIAESMADSHLVWSCKDWDGYGFMVHQAYATGRPVICSIGDYEYKIAGRMMEDMVTCVKLTGIWEDDKRKLEYVLDDRVLAPMCWEARKAYEANVNFDAEEQEIKKWLSEI